MTWCAPCAAMHAVSSYLEIELRQVLHEAAHGAARIASFLPEVEQPF